MMSKASGFVVKDLGTLFLLLLFAMMAASCSEEKPAHQDLQASKPADVADYKRRYGPKSVTLAELEQGTSPISGRVAITGAVRRPDLMLTTEEFVYLPYTSTPDAPASTVSFVVWFRARDLARKGEEEGRRALAEPTGSVDLRDDANDHFSLVTTERVNWRKPIYMMQLY